MALTPGTRLGVYEVTTQLGVGGMGEVYRATDTKLKRQVAIKILPSFLAADLDRLARFQREAEVLASLNHPNIAAIYGLEDADGVKALVLELVEGPTLADRIAHGPISVDEALPVARQIAEAIEAAHQQGIIHRDLKPANIKVRADGTVKVLDFGLAKAIAPASEDAPTLTTIPTQAGAIMGTPAYMSPEQARGEAAGRQADIWSFGVVLYEMLTGASPFGRHTTADTLASVLGKELDWNGLPPDTPPSIRRLLRRCLEKDRRKRLDSAADARLEIEDTLMPPAGERPSSRSAASRARPAGALTWFVTGVLVAAAIVGGVSWPWNRTRPPAAPVSRLDAQVGADAFLSFDLGDAIALSPDGALVAFVAQKRDAERSQLYVRRLAELTAAPLPGTDGAETPFFSPEGNWIGFFSGGKLRKIAVTGGPVVTLCDAPNGRGAVWNDDGTIVFAPFGGPNKFGLLRVPSAGGTPEPFTTPTGENAAHRWPQSLPGNTGILFTASANSGDYLGANIAVRTPSSDAPKIVWRRGYHARYLPIGHLAYVNDGTLFVVAFDLDRLEANGQPVPLVEGIASNPTTGAAQFAASVNGTIAYVRSGALTWGTPIAWMDREGRQTSFGPPRLNWFSIRIAPDGPRLALQSNNDIFVYEWSRETLTQVTFDPAADAAPLWTLDGRRITFRSMRDGNRGSNLYWQKADGTGAAERLTTSANTQIPGSWHPSRRFLAFSEEVAESNLDLMILPMEGDDRSGWKPGTPTRFTSGPFVERDPAFSPDGRWIAYVSNESGRDEVYVQAFPNGAARSTVSSGGGNFPTWSRVSRELFFSADAKIMVAPYTIQGDAFVPEKVRVWSDVRFGARVSRMFDLHPDGKQFAIAPVQNLQVDHLTLVFNVFDELRRLAPITP